LRRRKGNPNAREFPGDLSFGPFLFSSWNQSESSCRSGPSFCPPERDSYGISRHRALLGRFSFIEDLLYLQPLSRRRPQNPPRESLRCAARPRTLRRTAHVQRLVAPRLSFNRIFSGEAVHHQHGYGPVPGHKEVINEAVNRSTVCQANVACWRLPPVPAHPAERINGTSCRRDGRSAEVYLCFPVP